MADPLKFFPAGRLFQVQANTAFMALGEIKEVTRSGTSIVGFTPANTITYTALNIGSDVTAGDVVMGGVTADGQAFFSNGKQTGGGGGGIPLADITIYYQLDNVSGNTIYLLSEIPTSPQENFNLWANGIDFNNLASVIAYGKPPVLPDNIRVVMFENAPGFPGRSMQITTPENGFVPGPQVSVGLPMSDGTFDWSITSTFFGDITAPPADTPPATWTI